MNIIEMVNSIGTKFIQRFRSLPLSAKRLLGLGAVLGMFVALPLFIWAIATQTFLFNQKAASGEPPTPTPTATPVCLPRPACLDSVPRCLLPEPAEGWCKTPSPTPRSSCTGPDESKCTITVCPTCPPGQFCPLNCRVTPGICRNHTCLPIPRPTPIVRVIAPNGGENLKVGQNFTIRWQGDGLNSYSIYLLNSLGEISLINGASPSASTYNWVVNSPIMAKTSKHKIEVIENSDPGSFDLSDNYFTITRASATPSATPIPSATPTPTATSTPVPTPTSGPVPGDVNGDGKVNIIDIGIIIDNYKVSPVINPAADLNHDGVVNIVDIGIVVDNYQL